MSASRPDRALRGAMAVLPLIRSSLIEHEALITEAGVPHLLRKDGWIKLFRSKQTLAKAIGELERAKQHGVEAEMLDAKAIAQREPNLTGDFAGAIQFNQPGFVVDPGGLAKAYAALFRRKGGRFVAGDARTLQQDQRRTLARGDRRGDRSRPARPWWRSGPGPISSSARSAIRCRSRVKRGYHLHLAARGNAVLHHPVLDADQGFVLAPMSRGIRLTTAWSSPGEMRRRPRSRSSARCRRRTRCFRSASPSTPGRGWARVPACPTCCR